VALLLVFCFVPNKERDLRGEQNCESGFLFHE
jgi:hypothetical protein